MPRFRFHATTLRDSPAVRVWRFRNYSLFMGGLAPYYVTSWMQRVGIGWLAWELSHSYAWVGAVASAELVPLVVLGPFAGALADRSDPLRQMRWSQIAMIAQAVALTVVTMTGAVTIWLLFGLSLASGLIQPTYTAARQMVIPAAVPRSEYPSAITFDSTLFHGSRFIGPMLAAIFIAAWGVVSTFVVHIAGCLAFYVFVQRMDLVIPQQERKGQPSLLVSILEGVAYARAHEGIWPLFLMLSVASLFARPLQELLPGFAGGVFGAGATGLAWLTSAMGLGSLGAGIFMATRGHVGGLATGSIAATCALGLATFGFVATNRLGIALMFGVVWGFSLTLMGVGIQAQTQIAVADHMRGRVMMLYAMIYRGLPAVGALGIGVLSEALGIRSTFAFAAVITLAAWVAIAPRHKSIELAMSRKE